MDPILLHRVALADGHGIIFDGLEIHGRTVGRTEARQARICSFFK